MCLTAAGTRGRGAVKGGQRPCIGRRIDVVAAAQEVAVRGGRAAVRAGIGGNAVGMGWCFGGAQRVCLLTTELAEGMTGAHVSGCPALKVWQREVHAPISTERRTEQGEQRLVLIDRQQLPVATRPELGREPEGHQPDLREERLSHLTPYGQV